MFNYGHIVKLYSHFVYSPLNSYVYIHWILDFIIIIINEIANEFNLYFISVKSNNYK